MMGRTPTEPAGHAASTDLVGRVRGLPLAAHVVALALVLLVGLVAGAPGMAFTSDEGAAISQARVLDRTGGWLWENPMAFVDPEGEARAFLRGDLGDRGLAPYARKPVYPVVLLAADMVGGTIAMLLLSVAGTLVASVAAALLARRFDPGLDRWALWTCGVASPLFFDAYLVLAHTLAAAATALAVLAAVRAIERPAGSSAALAVVAAGLAAAVATSLRTEGAFVSLGLAAGAAAAWWRRSVPSGRAVALAVVPVSISAAVLFAERALLRSTVGEPLAGVGEAGEAPGWLAGRGQATVATWFDPSYSNDPVMVRPLALAVLLVPVVALLIRFSPGAAKAIRALAAVVVGLYAVRLATGRAGAVPGLLVAFPVAWGALWLVGRDLLATPARRAVVLAGATIVALVLLLQHDRGAGLEWGGRYFALALPVLIPPLVAAAAVAGRRLDVPTRRFVLACCVVVSLLLAAVGIHTLRVVHQGTESVLLAVADAAEVAGPVERVGLPVVVAWNPLLPQILYPVVERYGWVVPRRALLPEYLDRLERAGVQRVVYVTPYVGGDLSELGSWTVLSRHNPPGSPQEVVVLERPAD